ncbi:MAG: hypothetical protein AAF989_16550 [Planctomycetota bacterium]
MTRLQQKIEIVRARQQRKWTWHCLSTGMLVGGIAACILGLARWYTEGAFSWGWIAGLLAAGPILGTLHAVLHSRTSRYAAVAIDKACGLKDRAQSALQLGDGQESEQNAALRRLQRSDAEFHMDHVRPEQVVPMDRPRGWPIAILFSAAALLIAIVSGPPAEVTAADVRSEVVEQQASRVEDSLQELREVQQERDDPELNALVEDLEEMIEQLKSPGLDPKEALAKLSEMEASLQDMQQKLDDPQSAADLQKVGEALSLSEAMSVAGQALAKGEMEKAADELEKLEMPKLDRQTEKAVTEKLDKLNANDGNGTQKKSIQQAANQISQGLGKGNRSKFSDGMKGLAGAARKQGRRKRLVDLLKKQCKCLCECKSECESECRKQSESNKKGGNKAGSASSGNNPGEKTAKLKTSPGMNLKGQESSQGDIDVETESSDEQQQDAVRAYQQNAQEYEALSESVLESESIPLGHRQTIRRYFEMIRPNNGDVDAVIQRTDGDD